MRFDIVTIFPGVFYGPFGESVLARAAARGIVTIGMINPRDFTADRHRTVDDTPYGGGPGMLMKPEPLFKAVESVKDESAYVVLTTPQGEPFTQSVAREFAAKEHIVIVCGHYEGVDERVRTALVDREISLGDFVLTSGNIPAMAIVDAVTRLLPGALGDEASSVEESFSANSLEYPQYTRPVEFRGMKVPDVLLSGNHRSIAEWRREQALRRTRERRPDLLREKERFCHDSKVERSDEHDG